MHELRTILTAVQFYTVLPVPAFEFRPEYFQKILRYSSLVGLLIGGIGALIFWTTNRWYPVEVAVLLCLFGTAILTGCLHEDGFADFCDGLALAGDRAEKLERMRDSRLGQIGALAAILMILLRYVTLAALPASLIPVAILIGHSVGRFASAAYVFDLDYSATEASRVRAGGTQASGIKPTITRMQSGDLLTAGAVAGLTLCLAHEPLYLLTVPILMIAYLIFRLLLLRTLGGYTGDGLGAAQQFFEAVIYLTFAAVAVIAAEVTV
ncbi:MAG: adenosylcobinamide-GDP ribazoletransferase [Leptospirales bacterium]|jgi:adenosylcobinamide-GDP ribazoletransferase